MKIKLYVEMEMHQADVDENDNLCCKFSPRGNCYLQLFMDGETCTLFHEKLKFYNRTELYKRCQACIDAEVAAKKMEILK